MHKIGESQSQQQSVELSTVQTSTLTPSTTEESVTNAGQSIPGGISSREPLIYSSSSNPTTGSSQTPEDDFKSNGQSLPKLPGVIPLSGHNGPSGWL